MTAGVKAIPRRSSSSRVPGLWQGIVWALRRGDEGGGTSWPRLVWRTVLASVSHPKAMRRWMTVAFELHARGVVADLPGEYLRAVRPYVHRSTGFSARVVQLIDHVDWIETAFKPLAFERITSGQPLVLAELPAPRGYEFMRLQLQRAAPHSPEGELLLTLTLRRTADVQRKPQPVDAAVMGFSRFRIEGLSCLVIGGVRGQRHPVLRLSSMEINQALSGWKPAVLMVRVSQELARHWGLRLVGLDPDSHPLQGWSYQWRKRHREAAARVYKSYDSLWQHFEAKKGPPGWVILPLLSDNELEATALSPEKRARQTRRADYWIRIRNLLRLQLRALLMRPGKEGRLARVTESIAPDTVAYEDDFDVYNNSSGHSVPSQLIETGPGGLR